MNWSSSHERQLQAQKRARRDKFVWGPIGFFIGWLFSLFFNQWIVPLLPGPQAEVFLSGLSPATGNAAGCILYTVRLSSSEDIDSAYVKIAFPQNVKDTQVGYGAQAVLAESQEIGMQFWEAGRSPGGECAIVQAAVNINEGVSSIAVANVLTIRTSKMAGRTCVLGAVAVSKYDSAMKSATPIFDGNYEYTKWGLTIKRKMKFQYGGIGEAK
jgi:hypothetical protein